MTIHHAAIWLDHDRARVLHFEDQCFPANRFRKAVDIQAGAGGGGGLDAFFDEVCGSVGGIPQLLVTGRPAVIADFERYVESTMPGLAEKIVGVQPLDKPTNNGLAVLARWHFTARDATPR